MVKRQREKQYNSAREQRQLNQQRSGSAGSATGAGGQQKHLPFNHCALSLVPYTTPVCTRIKTSSSDTTTSSTGDIGIVFDNASIMPFVMKNKCDPVTGKKMTTRDLITLNIDKEEDHEGGGGGGDINNRKWQCPIIMKPLANHMKIVAIVQPDGTSANVYSYEAYKEFNVKAKNYEDLISGEKFNKNKDVIILNDPGNDELNRLRDMKNFYHIRHARELKSQSQSESNNVKHSKTASRVMEQLEKKKKEEQAEKEKKKKKKQEAAAAATRSNDDKDKDDGYVHYYVDNNREDDGGRKQLLKILASDVTLGGVEYTTNQASTSFTSTGVSQEIIDSDNRFRQATNEEVLESLFRQIKKMKNKNKGYVRLNIDIGGGGGDGDHSNDDTTTTKSMTFELHCDICPRTCYNFVRLCKSDVYNNTIFHRLIPNFMIQGGSTKESASSSSKKKDDNKDAAAAAAAAADPPRDGSIWGPGVSFKDEFDDRLKHDGAGVLAMANSGPHSNMQQFYITFDSCPHLNRKHTVFGKMIATKDNSSSDNVLKELEQAPTENKKKKDHRPTEPIRIVSIDVLHDPFVDARALEQQRIEKLIAERERKQRTTTTASAASAAAKSKTTTITKSKTNSSSGGGGSGGGSGGGVGRYLKGKLNNNTSNNNEKSKKNEGSAEIPTFSRPAAAAAAAAPPRPTKKTKFGGNFDGW